MPQLKNRHEEKCLFPIFPPRTYVPKRVCAFTRTQRHMHRVQLVNMMPSRFTLAYVPCCSRCRLSGARSRLHVCGYIPERACMYSTCVCQYVWGVGICMIICWCTSVVVWCYCIIGINVVRVTIHNCMPVTGTYCALKAGCASVYSFSFLCLPLCLYVIWPASHPWRAYPIRLAVLQCVPTDLM